MEFDLKLTRDLSVQVPRDDEILGACGGCDTVWTGESTCHCATCHLTFGSVTGFDDHRDRSTKTGPRCRPPDELRKRGYEPNGNGHWRRPRPEESIP